MRDRYEARGIVGVGYNSWVVDTKTGEQIGQTFSDWREALEQARLLNLAFAEGRRESSAE